MMESTQVLRQIHMILQCNIGISTALALSTVDCCRPHVSWKRMASKGCRKRTPKLKTTHVQRQDSAMHSPSFQPSFCSGACILFQVFLPWHGMPTLAFATYAAVCMAMKVAPHPAHDAEECDAEMSVAFWTWAMWCMGLLRHRNSSSKPTTAWQGERRHCSTERPSSTKG